MAKILRSWKSVVFICLFLVILFCAFMTSYFQPSKTMETLINSGSSSGSGSAANAMPNQNNGLDLTSIASMGNVACKNLWQSMFASANGYSMISALQEPDGTCIVDYIDNTGNFYTKTFSSTSMTKNPSQTMVPGTPAPSYDELVNGKTLVY